MGMTHMGMIDDTESPSKGIEVTRACTMLEVPKTELYGLRFYCIDEHTHYKKTFTELYDKAISKRLKIEKLKNDETTLDALKADKRVSDVSALLVCYPKGTAIGQHHVVRFEAAISGGNVEEKMAFAQPLLGKQLKMGEVFKSGEHVDIVAITIGKGWQGAIKRFGASRQFHKATQKIRHVGPLGAFTPAYVMYTVPRPGQMGYHYRTEQNKRILKIGSGTEKVNPSSGYHNYGVIRNESEYLMIEGSVAGASKRLVRIRRSIRNVDAAGIKEPKIAYVANIEVTK